MKPEQRLESIIRQLVNNDAISLADDTPLETLPGWHSVVRISLMYALEQQTGVRFTGTDIFAFETIGQLKRFVAANSRH